MKFPEKIFVKFGENFAGEKDEYLIADEDLECIGLDNGAQAVAEYQIVKTFKARQQATICRDDEKEAE